MSGDLTLILLILCAVGALAIGLAIFYLRRPRLEEAEGFYFQSQQGPIFYKKYGAKGPVVLLIHGLGASTYCWRNIAPDLAVKYQVIAIDLWGFGHSSKQLKTPMTLDSQVELIQALMKSLGVQKYNVVGHSMGAQIGLWLKHIDNHVDKCVAVTPAADPKLVASWLKRFAWVAKLTPFVLTGATIKRVLKNSLENPSFVTEDMVQSYFEPYIDPTAHRTFAAALDVIRDPRVRDHLKELDNSDLTFLFAAHDKLVSPKLMANIKSQLSSSRVVTHPWSGHLPMEDDPHWLVEQLFLTLDR